MEDTTTARHDHPANHVDDWDIVDEASLESFPASDPPAHGTHREPMPPPSPPAETAPVPRRTPGAASKVRSIAIAVIALGSLVLWLRRLRKHHAVAT